MSEDIEPNIVVETWCPNCGKAGVNIVPEACSWADAVKNCTECNGTTRCMTDVSTSDIAYFLSRKYHNKQEKEILRSLKEVEQELIDKTMRFYNGNISKSASSLGIGRATLYKKLEDKQTEEME